MKLGICYRPNLHKKFLSDFIDEISAIEIMPDIMLVKEMENLRDLCQQKNIDIGLHCLKSSLFSPEGPQINELENYYYVYQYLDAKYFSDHIAYSHYKNRYLSSVAPIEYSEKNIEVFKNNFSVLKEYFSNNFLIENITQYHLFSESEFSESQFIRKITESCSVDLMFDLTNMYITSKRNGLEFEDYIREYPFDRVKVLHVSGIFVDKNGLYQDTHEADLEDEILSLLEKLKDKMINLSYVFVERDFNVEKKEDILRDIKQLKRIFPY